MKSALNFVGNIGHALFGIATEADSKHLARNLKLLNEKDLALAHHFNGTPTVLNSTRVATTQNRKALRSLTEAVSSMKIASDKLGTAVYANDQVIKLGLSLTKMTSEVLRTNQTIQYLLAELGAISHKFMLAQTGVLHKKKLSPENNSIAFFGKSEKTCQQTTNYRSPPKKRMKTFV